MSKQIYWIIGIIILITLAFFVYFQQSNKIINDNSEKGFLEGKVDIGPICPVERFPEDPNCQPTEEHYKAWPIAVFSADKKIKVADIKPSLNGYYKIELKDGSYIVDLEKENQIGGSNLPVVISIKSGETITVDIDIDTGIR